jgi:hypothetical protein
MIVRVSKGNFMVRARYPSQRFADEPPPQDQPPPSSERRNYFLDDETLKEALCESALQEAVSDEARQWERRRERIYRGHRPTEIMPQHEPENPRQLADVLWPGYYEWMVDPAKKALQLVADLYEISVDELREAVARYKAAGVKVTAHGEPPAQTATPRLEHAASEMTAPQAPAPVAPRLEHAATETTDRATVAPRLDWIEARKEPGKVADLLAQFIRAKFAGELGDGTMSTDKLYRYKSLYQAFYDHRSELPPDLRSIPTKSRSIDRLVAAGKVKPVRPSPPRTDEQRVFEREKTQVQRARQRGGASP